MRLDFIVRGDIVFSISYIGAFSRPLSLWLNIFRKNCFPGNRLAGSLSKWKILPSKSSLSLILYFPYDFCFDLVVPQWCERLIFLLQSSVRIFSFHIRWWRSGENWLSSKTTLLLGYKFNSLFLSRIFINISFVSAPYDCFCSIFYW